MHALSFIPLLKMLEIVILKIIIKDDEKIPESPLKNI
jgi:hypothetical protein